MFAREQIFWDRTNPLEFSDVYLIQAYRFPRVSIIKLTERIADKLNEQKGNCALLPIIQVQFMLHENVSILLQ